MGSSKFIWGFGCLACPRALDFRENLFWLQFLSGFLFFYFSDWVFVVQHKIKPGSRIDLFFFILKWDVLNSFEDLKF